MKKNILKMVSCIVLSTVMVLVGVLPSMASGSDDLTGWTYGTNNTITGNPTDGWDLTLSNYAPLESVDMNNVGTYAAYEFDGLASELKMTMDISGLEIGKDFWFVISSQPLSIYQWAWDGSKIVVCFKRTGDTTLDIYGHNGGAETAHALFDNFDFTASHVLEFLKDGNGEYHLALDGELCLLSWAAGSTSGTVDDYVTIGGEENDVVVSFAATAAAIKDLKISKKVTSTPTPTPTETPTATPDGSASATPGVPNKPTGDVSMFVIVALVLAVGAGMMVLRKKSCKE